MITISVNSLQGNEKDSVEEDPGDDDLSKSTRGLDLSLRTLLMVFIPLGMTSFIYPFTKVLLNAGIARMANPEISLAAFAVTNSVIFILNSPGFMTRQLTVSLIEGRQSYRMVRRFTFILPLILTGLIGITAFSPVGRFIMQRIIGIEGLTLEYALICLKVLTPMPLISFSRNFFQGIAILMEKPSFVPLGAVFRLMYLIFILLVISPMINITGTLFGGIIFISSMLIELTFLFIGLKMVVKDPQKAVAELNNHQDKKINFKDIIRFFTPLVFTALILAFLRPLINAGLARIEDAELYLASFAMGFSLLMTIIGPVNMLDQLVIKYAEGNNKDNSILIKFVLYITLVFILLVSVIAFSPIGIWLLQNFMGASNRILPSALNVLKAGVFIVVVRVWRKYYWGVFIKQRKTGKVGKSKAVNIIFMVIALFLGLNFMKVDPAVIAMIAYSIGEGVEVIYLYLLNSYQPQQKGKMVFTFMKQVKKQIGIH